MTERKNAVRILSLLLALCLLWTMVPAALAGTAPWETWDVPYPAKVKTGEVFYTDKELTEVLGTLEKDALVLVTEIEEKTGAAKIQYTEKRRPKDAWVEGKNLIPVDIATPTDLEERLENEDVVLILPEVPEEKPEVPAGEPETPAEEPEIPAEEPEIPAEEPEAPAEEPEVPAEEPEIPAEEPEIPAEEPEIPAEEPEIPAGEEPAGEEDPAVIPEEEPEPAEEPAEEPAAEPAAEEEPAVTEEEPLPGPAEPEAPEAAEEEEPEAVPEEGEAEETEYAFGSLEEEEQEREEIAFEDLPQGEDDVSGEASAVYEMDGDTLAAVNYIGETDLPEVRNQNPYATCWAFSAIGAMEIDLIRDGKATGTIDLSEFFLVYFSAHNYPYPKEGGEGDSVTYTGTGLYLDNGGHSPLAYHILATLIGTTFETDNPYPDKDHADQLPSSYTSIAAQITGAYSMSASDKDLLKQQIQEHGSVKVSVYMPKAENYNKIVKVGGKTVAYNSNTASLFSNYNRTNHDVLLIGWDDDYAKENFLSGVRPTANGAWKARNSWGTSFGKNGYFWISYEDAALTAGKAVSFDAENEDVADYCYSYDKSYAPTLSVIVKDKAVIRQSFRVGARELLRSVGIEIAARNDLKADVTISATVTIGSSEVKSEVKEAPYAGFYLLKLNSPYLISSETSVTVEVTVTANTPGEEVHIPYQYADSKNVGDIQFTAGVGSGGFTLNGSKVDGDSTIKLYTKRESSTGLVTGITLDKTAIDTIESGDTVLLAATITPADATNPNLRWYSSDETVAYLDPDTEGLVVGGKKSGTAVITVMSSNGISASCTVKVNQKELPLTALDIKDYDHTYRIDDTTGTGIKLGDRLKLEVELTPKYTAENGVTWKTSDSSVLSIVSQSNTGCEVLLNKNGTARITASSTVHPEISDWVEFTIYLPNHVTSVTLDKTTLSLWEEENDQLTATVYPTDAENLKVTWTSDNPNVATVTDTGFVTAVKDGTAVITVTTEDGGKTATCLVIVSTKNPIEAFVYRMYRVCLLREPDPSGFATWVEQLVTGKKSGAQIALQFFNSKEMRGRNLSDGDYVERCYEGMMGRASDPAGKETWVKKLESGMSRKAIISGFVKSNEFSGICSYYLIDRGDYDSDEARDVNLGVTGFVSRLYTKMLGRAYDPDGLNHWCAKILEKMEKETLLTVALNGFMLSKEFVEKGLSNEEFVKVLYRTFLGREADEGGLKHWVAKLEGGAAREDIAAGFARSEEFSAIMAQYGF